MVATGLQRVHRVLRRAGPDGAATAGATSPRLPATRAPAASAANAKLFMTMPSTIHFLASGPQIQLPFNWDDPLALHLVQQAGQTFRSGWWAMSHLSAIAFARAANFCPPPIFAATKQLFRHSKMD